jgi:hypothetical protein
MAIHCNNNPGVHPDVYAHSAIIDGARWCINGHLQVVACRRNRINNVMTPNSRPIFDFDGGDEENEDDDLQDYEMKKNGW